MGGVHNRMCCGGHLNLNNIRCTRANCDSQLRVNILPERRVHKLQKRLQFLWILLRLVRQPTLDDLPKLDEQSLLLLECKVHHYLHHRNNMKKLTVYRLKPKRSTNYVHEQMNMGAGNLTWSKILSTDKLCGEIND